MKRLRGCLKWLLLIWGSFTLVITIALGVFISYQLTITNRDKDDLASPDDVRFVLNWCGFGDNRIERVIHSHISARSFTGDHLDAFAIKVSKMDEVELESKTNNFEKRWYRCDQLPPMLAEAIKFVDGWHHEIPWFPGGSELRSSNFYVSVWSVYFHGDRPTAADLIFVRPSDQMVFYFGGKT